MPIPGAPSKRPHRRRPPPGPREGPSVSGQPGTVRSTSSSAKTASARHARRRGLVVCCRGPLLQISICRHQMSDHGAVILPDCASRCPQSLRACDGGDVPHARLWSAGRTPSQWEAFLLPGPWGGERDAAPVCAPAAQSRSAHAARGRPLKTRA